MAQGLNCGIRPALESAPLGDRYVLYSKVSGAILTTDTAGKALFTNLRKSDVWDKSAIDAGLEGTVALTTFLSGLPARANSILEAWTEAGLFARQLPFVDPVADDGAPAQNVVAYRTCLGTIEVQSNDPVFAAQLDDILGRYTFAGSQGPSGRTVQDPERYRCLRLELEGRTAFGLFRKRQPIWGRMSLDEARFMLVREAAEVLTGLKPVGAVLHGSAVCHSGAALLFTGVSGRGKSTLAQSLVATGCGYLADDHIPLHRNGTDVLSFPVAAAVKPGSLDVDGVRDLLATFGAQQSARDGVRYLDLPGARPVGTRIPIRAVVLPSYKEKTDLLLERISPEEAFIGAIQAGARPTRHAPTIRPLARLFSSVPAYRLSYANTHAAVSTCLDLLDSHAA